MPVDTGEFMLVADDEGTYVAATAGVRAMLGYDPNEVVGRRIQDLAAEELVADTPRQWADFLAAGRQDGRFRLRTKDGRSIAVHYQARAHHPVPGFHMSRLWPERGPAPQPTE
jgi:PAS domain S-box-containing protein